MTARAIVPSATLKTRILAALRRALRQFLGLPTAVVFGFVVLAFVAYDADRAWSQGAVPSGFAWLGELMGDRASLAGLLATVASSIITVTSITFSLLLVALQQGSSALTAQVSDQFLMRRSNQFYFGFFVGLSVYVLLTLVTVSAIHRPVFGASLALVLTTIALCMIVVMIYNTIDQMRPVKIVNAIHRHILSARNHERDALAKTRRAPRPGTVRVATIRSRDTGHLAALRPDRLAAALERNGLAGGEIEVLVPVGGYVAFGDAVLALRSADPSPLPADRLAALTEAALAALVLDDDRTLDRDPAYGIEQLTTIAWTSTSTAKSNPSPGRAVLASLRDILGRWAEPECRVEEDEDSPVIVPDATPGAVLDALDLIVTVASESIQAQTLADALRTLASLVGRVEPAIGLRLADNADRVLASLGEHVPTRDLESALAVLAEALAEAGHDAVAGRVRGAAAEFGTTVGALNSRSTRVPSKI
jgi:uncharacterized membrane protein